MWTVIYVSQSPDTAAKLIDALYEHGIVSRLRRAGEGGSKEDCCEVLVPSTEMEEAQNLMIESDLF